MHEFKSIDCLVSNINSKSLTYELCIMHLYFHISVGVHIHTNTYNIYKCNVCRHVAIDVCVGYGGICGFKARRHSSPMYGDVRRCTPLFIDVIYNSWYVFWFGK